jgi:hypothetical protein
VVRYQQSGKPELYNIEEDLYEESDQAQNRTKLLKEMDNLMQSQSVANPHWPFSGKK